MSVSPEEVRRTARLAEIEVSDAELPTLTAELNRIVEFVGQLGDEEPSSADAAVGEGVRLRPDRVAPAANIDLREIAPALRDGFFVVPRLAALESE